MVQKYYTDILSYKKNLNLHFFNHSKIINQINLMKKFNLDDKSTFILIKDILKSDEK